MTIFSTFNILLINNDTQTDTQNFIGLIEENYLSASRMHFSIQPLLQMSSSRFALDVR